MRRPPAPVRPARRGPSTTVRNGAAALQPVAEIARPLERPEDVGHGRERVDLLTEGLAQVEQEALAGALGLPLELLGRHWVVILGFLESCGGPFWVSGGVTGRLRRAIASKDRRCLLASLHFKRFWYPKGGQKAPKMELKSIKNGVKKYEKTMKNETPLDLARGGGKINSGS